MNYFLFFVQPRIYFLVKDVPASKSVLSCPPRAFLQVRWRCPAEAIHVFLKDKNQLHVSGIGRYLFSSAVFDLLIRGEGGRGVSFEFS